jgi:hypothetical protein
MSEELHRYTATISSRWRCPDRCRGSSESDSRELYAAIEAREPYEFLSGTEAEVRIEVAREL